MTKNIDRYLKEKIYNILYFHSTLSESEYFGVRVIHEDNWPIEEIKQFISDSISSSIKEHDKEIMEKIEKIRKHWEPTKSNLKDGWDYYLRGLEYACKSIKSLLEE